MKIVQVFKTDDGKTFESRIDARKHEVTVEALAKLNEILKVSLATGRPESVLRQLLMENSEVSAVLATYRKKQPAQPNVITVKKEAAASKAA